MKRPRCRRRHTRRPAHVRRWSEKRHLNSRSDIRAVVRATPAAPAEAPHETNRIGSRHQHVVVPTSTQFGQHSRGLDAGSPGDFLCREGRRGASTPHHRSRITQNPCRSGMAPISSITGRYLLDFERHCSGRRAACASEIHRVIPAEDRWCLISRGSGLPTSPGNTAPGFVEASGARDSERDSQCASPRRRPGSRRCPGFPPSTVV